MYQSCWNASSWYGVAVVLHGRLDVPAGLTLRMSVIGWTAIAITGKKKEKSSQEWKGRWRDRGDRGKVWWLYHISYQGRALECPADFLTLPSLSLIPCHLTLLPLVSARWERYFTDSRACRRYWGYLKSCQFNSCVYGLGPGWSTGK